VSVLEIIAVVVSVLGIWLATRRKLSSWPISIVACLLYVVVFQRARLYSDMLLQFVFAVFTLYGWWHWSRGVKEDGEVRVEPLSVRAVIGGIAAGAAGSVLLGYVMAHYTDAAIPHIDSALTSFSLVATVWAARKHIANWWLWIVVDLIYTGVFTYKHLYLTSGLYLFFVFLALLGLRDWQKAFRQQQAAAASA